MGNIDMSGTSFDSSFSFGLDTTNGFAEALTGINTEAEKFRNAVGALESLFNQENLWKGKDAQALIERVTCDGGPFSKLKVVADELDKLAELSKTLGKAVSDAEQGLQTNVNNAFNVGGN